MVRGGRSPEAAGGFDLYASVFISAFLAATIIPAQSEAVLAYQLLTSPDALVSLVAVATLGNLLGAMVNWWLGRFFVQYSDRPWFPLRPESQRKAERFYRRYGRYSLLLSWLPFIGDPITVVAGALREPLWSFVLLVGIAKAARYVAIALMVSGAL